MTAPTRTPHQHQRRGLHRDIRAGAERDSQVRLRQAGSIVHAVADHGDHPAFLLKFANDGHLELGQGLGDPLIGADLAGHRRRRAARIAGDQHGAYATAPQVGAERGGLRAHSGSPRREGAAHFISPTENRPHRSGKPRKIAHSAPS